MGPVRRAGQLLLDVAGAAGVTIGAWLIAPALGLIVGGLIALGLAAALDKGRRQ